MPFTHICSNHFSFRRLEICSSVQYLWEGKFFHTISGLLVSFKFFTLFADNSNYWGYSN